jgi:hypothetical protein
MALLSFKFPAATGAVDAYRKPEKIFFQKFMFDDFIALTAAYWAAEFFRSMLVFYFQDNLILAQFQQIQLTTSHFSFPQTFVISLPGIFSGHTARTIKRCPPCLLFSSKACYASKSKGVNNEYRDWKFACQLI